LLSPAASGTRPIFLLNFLLGWTLVGWIIAQVWAAKVDDPAAVG